MKELNNFNNNLVDSKISYIFATHLKINVICQHLKNL